MLTDLEDANEEIDTAEDYEGLGKNYNDIKAGLDTLKSRDITSIKDMPQEVKEKLRFIVMDMDVDWTKPIIEGLEAEKIRDAIAKANFTDQEKKETYEGVGSFSGKRKTLGTLLNYLQHFSENCHRVEASNFIIPGLYG